MYTLRTMRLLGAILATLTAIGCGAESSESSSASPERDAAAALRTTTDDGGHPLSSLTEDPGTLAFESEVLRLVNDHRVSKGLSALTDSPALRATARAHSQHMAMHPFFGHASPEGLSAGDRLGLNGIAWGSVGENIAAGYETPQAAFDAWMGSPEHRTNIESIQWTHAGAGYALDGAPSEEFPHGHFWTLDFVRR